MEAVRRSPRLVLSIALVLAVVLGLAALVVAPGSVDAEPAPGTHIKYYDGPACDYQIGFRYYDCDWVLQSSWGVTSQYEISNTYGCTPEF